MLSDQSQEPSLQRMDPFPHACSYLYGFYMKKKEKQTTTTTKAILFLNTEHDGLYAKSPSVMAQSS